MIMKNTNLLQNNYRQLYRFKLWQLAEGDQ